MASSVRKRIAVSGVVQGVGFRPFVWRRASRFGLAGWVGNDPAGVIAEVQGPPGAVARFLDGLAAAAPPLAVVERIDVADRAVEESDRGPFAIHTSAVDDGGAASIPADVGPCAACLADVADAAGRRHRHPFATCTDCGPRYTIITGLPYDRPRTTMRAFAMCPECAREYADPGDRRFHAQPNACPACGPRLWLETGGADDPRPVGDEALAAARALLRDGRIVAVKGVGGFHLACDATNAAAVALLRDRKGRVGKPLAVLVADVDAARRLAHVSGQEAGLLASPERPIVLVRKRAAAVAEAVSPGNHFLGVALPSSPLHHLLAAGMPPLVLTSGNRAEEPIVRDEAAARRVLGPLADAFLMHDRPIAIACDDSIVRCAAGAVLPVRRARGYAPLPIRLAVPGPRVLAVGGELKAALCLADGDRAIMSQHLGDVGDVDTLDVLDHTAGHLLRLFGVEPESVAADLHPGYLSTDWARRFAAARNIPLVLVQHHEAHAAALLAEHGWHGRDAIVACFDGTGYGRDGTIQGGEFLVASAGGLRRAAHLALFPLPGGDASIRHPWRTALALLHAANVPWDAELPPVRAATGAERAVLGRQVERAIACTATSSMGRLFDGLAALAGVRQSITYEAEAAMNLEALAAVADDAAAYEFHVDDAAPAVVDWRGVVRAAAADVVAGVPAAAIAARFHRGVAGMIATVCERLRARGAGETAGLTGGVFQNALLVELTVAELHRRGFEVLLHGRVPPNDGGLALGQATLARAAAG